MLVGFTALITVGILTTLSQPNLLLFGRGIVTGGAFSVKIVPVMGMCCLVVDSLALLCPAAWHTRLIAAESGILNTIFGVVIAWRQSG